MKGPKDLNATEIEGMPIKSFRDDEEMYRYLETCEKEYSELAEKVEYSKEWYRAKAEAFADALLIVKYGIPLHGRKW